MNTAEKQTNDRVALASTGESIRFCCSAPGAKSVFLVGDFNDWNSTSHPLEPWRGGWWSLHVALTPGRHYYRFLVDGEMRFDPLSEDSARDVNNRPVSVITLI